MPVHLQDAFQTKTSDLCLLSSLSVMKCVTYAIARTTNASKDANNTSAYR
jgi:hypothetical protein